MKHGSNPRRGRSRGGNSGKRHQPSRNHTHDSNGPEGKVRGSAQQVHEKYLSLARDATAAGEHIAAEGFYQYAEHYYRLVNADGANNQARNNQQQNDQQQSGQQRNDQQRDGDQKSQADDVVSKDGSDDENQPKARRNSRKPREAVADVEVAASDDAVENKDTVNGGSETSIAEDSNADKPNSKDSDSSDDTELVASA